MHATFQEPRQRLVTSNPRPLLTLTFTGLLALDMSTQEDTAPICPLLAIPPELRLNIYENLFRSLNGRSIHITPVPTQGSTAPPV